MLLLMTDVHVPVGTPACNSIMRLLFVILHNNIICYVTLSWYFLLRLVLQGRTVTVVSHSAGGMLLSCITTLGWLVKSSDLRRK